MCVDDVIDFGWAISYPEEYDSDDAVDYKKFFIDVFGIGENDVRVEGHDRNNDLIGTIFINKDEFGEFKESKMRRNGMEFCESDKRFGERWAGRFEFNGMEYGVLFFGIPTDMYAEAV